MKTILPLTLEDVSPILAIEQTSHAFPWSEKTLRSNFGERYLNYKIMCGGEIAGFAIVQTVLDEATLFNIAVAKHFQRMGLGRQLLQHVIEQLTIKQINTLWLEVRESNKNAIKLYDSMAFNEVTVRAHYYPSQHGREDAIVMAKYL